jgi:hypothetical protein
MMVGVSEALATVSVDLHLSDCAAPLPDPNQLAARRSPGNSPNRNASAEFRALLAVWVRTPPKKSKTAAHQADQQEHQRGSQGAEPGLAKRPPNQGQHHNHLQDPERERDAAYPVGVCRVSSAHHSVYRPRTPDPRGRPFRRRPQGATGRGDPDSARNTCRTN